MRWVLWSREQGVVSHDTAASVWAIGVANPVQVHLTVPPSFRAHDDTVVLHRVDLPRSDVTTYEYVTITTPLRTVLDIADAHFDEEFVLETLDDAMRRGLVSRRQMLRRLSDTSARARSVLARGLDERQAS